MVDIKILFIFCIFLISAKICAGIIDRKPNNKIQNMQPESQNDFDDMQRK